MILYRMYTSFIFEMAAMTKTPLIFVRLNSHYPDIIAILRKDFTTLVSIVEGNRSSVFFCLFAPARIIFTLVTRRI